MFSLSKLFYVMIIALNDEVVRMGGGMLHKDVPNNTLDGQYGVSKAP